MAHTNSAADERDLVVTDNVILSHEGGRWSVTLGDHPRGRPAGAVPESERSTARR